VATNAAGRRRERMGRGKGEICRHAGRDDDWRAANRQAGGGIGKRQKRREREGEGRKKRRRVGQEPREMSLCCGADRPAPSQSGSLAAVLILACLCHRMIQKQVLPPPSPFVLL
jgi:hypothetical protein